MNVLGNGLGTFSIVFLAAVLFIGFQSIKIVKQGYEYTVLRLGRFSRILKPGFHILVPFWETVGKKVNMKEQILDVPRQEVISKDNALISVNGVVFFQILDSAKSAYAVDNLYLAIENLTMTNLRTVMGSMSLDDLNFRRDSINAVLLKNVDAATDAWGVKVTRIEIQDIRPPEDLVQAMSRQKKAEQLKRAQILESEGQRQAEILEAEGKRQAEILKAEGKKQARVLEAEAQREAAFLEAEARERLAEAEAKATQLVSQAISKGDVQAINYFVAQKYVEALGKFAESSNQKTFFLPMEANGILGSLAGITELLGKNNPLPVKTETDSKKEEK